MEHTRPNATQLVADIRGAGLRLTAPRMAVLAQVWQHPHADVDTITAGARDQLGAVSTQAVYDALRVLTDVDLIRRIEPAGSPARYDAQTGDNHHHVVCHHCGAIADVPCAVGAYPCLTPSVTHGFEVTSVEVTFWGTCPECASSALRLAH